MNSGLECERSILDHKSFIIVLSQASLSLVVSIEKYFNIYNKKVVSFDSSKYTNATTYI
jgi:hypothetical protein